MPFNHQIFDPSNEVTISSGLVKANELREVFVRAFQPMYFPIPLVDTLKNLKFVEFDLIVADLKDLCSLSTIKLNHPGGAAGYIVERDNKKVCVFLDHEYGQEARIDDHLINIARESDLIVWDGMFLDEELPPKKGWGHSSIEQGIALADKIDVKNFLISHHSPSRDDKEIKDIENKISNKKVKFASENEVIEF